MDRGHWKNVGEAYIQQWIETGLRRTKKKKKK